MTKKNIRESIISTVGASWISENGIEPDTIDDMIVDELEEFVADTTLLEGLFTGTGDGTNPYIEVPEKIFIVKRLHYDYTSGSDEGDILEEISPLSFTGEYTGEDPEYYWLQGMHRVDRQRIYFNEIPASTKTIKALFYKFPDDISTDTQELELKRLWVKAIKHIIAAKVCTMGKTVGQNNIKKDLKLFEMGAYNKAMKVINEIPKYPMVAGDTVFNDA